MTIPQKVGEFCQKYPHPSLPVLVGFMGGKPLSLFKIFGRVNIRRLSLSLQEQGGSLQKILADLDRDFRHILSSNYENLKKEAKKLNPLPEASWHQKRAVTNACDDEAMARNQLLLFLQTSEMPMEIAFCLDLQDVKFIKKHLDPQDKLLDDAVSYLFEVLQPRPNLNAPEPNWNELQLALSRSASLALYQGFVSYAESIHKWRTYQPAIVDGFLKKCKLLQILHKTQAVQKELFPAVESFQDYLIHVTRKQIQKVCPLAYDRIEELTETLSSEPDRRRVSFFLFLLQDIFSSEQPYTSRMCFTQEPTPFYKAQSLLDRLQQGLDIRTVKFLQSLTYVKTFSSFVSISLQDQCAVFEWAYNSMDLPLLANFVTGSQEYAKEIFSKCYELVSKDCRLEEFGVHAFLTLVHCQYYLHLNDEKLQFLSKHLENDNRWLKCFGELENYVRDLVKQDPIQDRQRYLEGATKSHSSFCTWKSFEKEDRTLEFLQAVESCLTQQLPSYIVLRVLCYPFDKDETLSVVHALQGGVAFDWSCIPENLSLSFKFTSGAHDHVKETFTRCYQVFSKKFVFEGSAIDLFLMLMHCQYYLNLKDESLQFLFEHLQDADSCRPCFEELEKYISKIQNPLEDRKKYIEEAAKSHSSLCTWETFQKEDRTLEFLQAVESCIEKQLPPVMVFKAFCYPFDKESVIQVLQELQIGIDFDWSCIPENLSPPSKFFGPPDHVKATFYQCYKVFSKTFNFEGLDIGFFLVLMHCQYYLNLKEESLQFLFEHLQDENSCQKCIKELEQYIACLKIKDPVVDRQKYLEKTVRGHSSFHKKTSIWKWESFQVEDRTLEFLQTVESCIRRRLPSDIVILAFCYPFYKQGAVQVVQELQNYKLKTKVKNVFLPAYSETMRLVSELKDSKNTLGPGMNWLNESHPAHLDKRMATIGDQLKTSILSTPFYLKKIAKSVQVFFPNDEKHLAEVSCLQNLLISTNSSANLAFLAKWHVQNKPFLEMTFLFSPEKPHSKTVRISLPLLPKDFKLPFLNEMLHALFQSIGHENLNEDLQKELDCAESEEEELALCCQYIENLDNAVEKFQDRAIATRLFSFVKRLKIEARYVIASFFTDSDESEDEHGLVILASKKRIYALEDGLSLLPPQITTPLFCILDSDYVNEIAFIEEIVHTKKPSMNPRLFTIEMAKGNTIQVDFFFHPRPIQEGPLKPHGNYNEITLHANGVSYTVHYGSYVKQTSFPRMLRWQLLMLQSSYYEKKFLKAKHKRESFSEILAPKVVQED